MTSRENNKTKSNILRRRAVLLLIAAMSLFALFGCSDISDEVPTESPSEQKAEERMILPVNADDTLNPYTCRGKTNFNLLSLCYEPLVRINSSYNTENVLCSSIVCDGRTAYVYLRRDVTFSDGTPLTARDCIYSFSQAKAAGGVYTSRFDTIRSCQAENDTTLRIVFENESIYNANLLDIPIIKSNSLSSPVGTGIYVLMEDSDGMYLTKSKYPSYHGDTADSAADIVSLISASGMEEQLYAFNYGNCEAMHASSEYGSFRGNTEVVRYTTNDLVFAVLNTSRQYLASPDTAKGLLYCIDRENIVKNVFASFAEAVWYPFCPAWTETINAALNNDIYSSSLAHEAFVSAGLKLNGSLKRTFKGAPVTLSVIVCNENRQMLNAALSVAADLRNMGFETEISRLTYSKYKEAISKGNYDIYIAEATLPCNMDLSPLLKNNVLRNGGKTSQALLDAVAEFNAGNTDMRSLLGIWREYPPFIPLCYKKDAVAVKRTIHGTFAPCTTSEYTGFETWHHYADGENQA